MPVIENITRQEFRKKQHTSHKHIKSNKITNQTENKKGIKQKKRKQPQGHRY